MGINGKIGERLQINANYDTEASFDFQNIFKLDYTPTEDDIIQSIEIGNVNKCWIVFGGGVLVMDGPWDGRARLLRISKAQW